MARINPEFLDRIEHQYGKSSADAIVAAFKYQRLPTIRTNTLKTTDDAVMQAFRDDAIQFERVAKIPHTFFIKNRKDSEMLEHHLMLSGQIYMQGIASMLPVLVLDPKPGEAILDLCAAPGSKTTQIASIMKGTGKVVAVEENEIRFQKLKNSVWMQGAKDVELMHADGTLLHYDFAGKFDRVLVDAPCSAEGRIDLRDARSFSFWSTKNIGIQAKLQRRLLRSAVRCLKPGGTLVYSTCTLAPEENELMVDWAFSEFPELLPLPVELPVATTRTLRKNAAIALPTKEHEGSFVARFRLHD